MKNCLLSLACLALAMFPYVGLAQAESDEPVTLPEGADVWTCTLEGSYTAIGDNASPSASVRKWLSTTRVTTFKASRGLSPRRG